MRHGRDASAETAARDVVKIISGGQSGVDRAALDAAIAAGLDYGGWCPKGGWAEDFPDPPGLLARYGRLRETPSAGPRQRTEWNVRDADRLLVLVDARGLAVSEGTADACDFATALGKPQSVVDVDRPEALPQALAFVRQGGTALCIAGPRESEAPGIYGKARPFLCALFANSIHAV